jgi:hypothetical protein
MADLPTVTPQLCRQLRVSCTLYGDGRMPASPTSKPEAGVLEERPLAGHGRSRSTVGCQKSRGGKKGKNRKPAAVVAAAVTVNVGSRKVVAASATKGH